MPYYAWLAPDLTSQHDRTVAWRVGAPQELPGPVLATSERSAHLLRIPVEALRFGRWPGRLFEVEVDGAPDDATVTARLTREASPGEVFGPRGDRLVAFVGGLRDSPWFQASGPATQALAAATEHQELLRPWGWRPVPVRLERLADWHSAAALARTAYRPATRVGATAAWAAGAPLWSRWAAPWAAWAAWHATHDRVEADVGSAAWAVARRVWNGATDWPAPLNPAWRDLAVSVRSSILAATTAASDDAARSAEHLVCAALVSPDPFEPLMRVWACGYWPMGVIDGSYVIGDPSAIGPHVEGRSAAVAQR